MKAHVVAALTAGFVSVLGKAQKSALYPLKQRGDQAATTIRFNLTDLPIYGISYSEDSSPKLLTRFIIALFETDGQLPFYPSLFNVEMAMQDFVEAELNSAYAPFSLIKDVHAKVVSQKNTASTRNMRSLQMRGSELEMELNVTFANEPSPDISDVDLALKNAMENLTYFLTNLTNRAEGDRELENVHSAFRLEISDANSIQEPTDEVGGKEPEAKPSNIKFIIPLVCAFCAATLLIGLFAVRRQRTSRIREARARGYVGDDGNLHWDDESDIFSFETALLETPHEKNLPMKTWTSEGGGMSKELRYGDEDMGANRSRFGSHDESSYQFTEIALDSPNRGSVITSSICKHESDVNDKIESTNPVDPPRDDVAVTKKGPRSVFGLFPSRPLSAPQTDHPSRNTNNSLSTSQVVPQVALAVPMGSTEKAITPDSCTSSVFTFSDEDEGLRELDVRDDVMDIVGDIEGGYQANWQRRNIGNLKHEVKAAGSFDHSQAENAPSKEDLSLSGELIGLSVAGTQSRDAITSPRSVQSKPFDEESPPRDQPESFTDSRSHFPSGQPLPDFPPSSMINERKSMSDSKIRREKEPVTLRPKSFSDSKPRSRLHGTSYDWESEDPTGAKKNLSHSTNGYYDWGVTLRPVRSPSLFQNELNTPNGVTRSSNVYLKNTSSEGRDRKSFDALWENDEVSIVYKIGRRHTKSMVADGTTNYQSEAMDPTDWSVSTGEDGSCASTEVADTTPQTSGKKKRNFLSDFFSGSKKKSIDNFEDAKARVSVEQSPESTATDEDVAEAEAASHKQQLINDLGWLENRIASSYGALVSSPDSQVDSSIQRSLELGNESRNPLESSKGDSILEDSLSFPSGDQSRSYFGSSLDTTADLLSPGAKNSSNQKGLQTILCRDCFAPPGKLKIIIQSTKDGPAIHTVKPDSALTGHIFPGDLIVSVDDVDTRSFTAEQVMKMMTERARYERKITVLHFDKTEDL
jgi:hypothetical protein